MSTWFHDDFTVCSPTYTGRGFLASSGAPAAQTQDEPAVFAHSDSIPSLVVPEQALVFATWALAFASAEIPPLSLTGAAFVSEAFARATNRFGMMR